MNLYNGFHHSSIQKQRYYMTASGTRRLIRSWVRNSCKLTPANGYYKNHMKRTDGCHLCEGYERSSRTGVALIQQFNASLTRNEEQKHMKVVKGPRSKFSVPVRGALSSYQELQRNRQHELLVDLW